MSRSSSLSVGLVALVGLNHLVGLTHLVGLKFERGSNAHVRCIHAPLEITQIANGGFSFPKRSSLLYLLLFALLLIVPPRVLSVTPDDFAIECCAFAEPNSFNK